MDSDSSPLSAFLIDADGRFLFLVQMKVLDSHPHGRAQSYTRIEHEADESPVAKGHRIIALVQLACQE
jgi:hypothetical protein